MTFSSLSRFTQAALPLLLLAAVSGCAMKKSVTTPVPTLKGDMVRLQNDIDILPPFPVPPPATGSLWTDGGPGAALTRDTRAFRVNDLVTIRISESSTGKNSSTTDMNRSSENKYGASIAFGLENPNASAGRFNLGNVLETSNSSKFAGDGSTDRSSALSAFVTARVMRVLPNGDLVIGGQKTVMINRDRQILTLVGSIRPTDINSSNRVDSSAVGDLTVRLWGQGEVDANARQGWFVKYMNRLWPF